MTSATFPVHLSFPYVTVADALVEQTDCHQHISDGFLREVFHENSPFHILSNG